MLPLSLLSTPPSRPLSDLSKMLTQSWYCSVQNPQALGVAFLPMAHTHSDSCCLHTRSQSCRILAMFSNALMLYVPVPYHLANLFSPFTIRQPRALPAAPPPALPALSATCSHRLWSTLMCLVSQKERALGFSSICICNCCPSPAFELLEVKVQAFVVLLFFLMA